jgi:hypothetical protein
MYNTLQSGLVAKEKDAPRNKAKKSPSHVLYFALVRSLKKKCIVSWPKVLSKQLPIFLLLQRYRSALQNPVHVRQCT